MLTGLFGFRCLPAITCFLALDTWQFVLIEYPLLSQHLHFCKKMTENSCILSQEKWCHLAEQSLLTTYNSFPHFPVPLTNRPYHQTLDGILTIIKNPGGAPKSPSEEMSVPGFAFTAGSSIPQHPSNLGKFMFSILCFLWGDSFL